ncbi:hypothetical protein PQX77_008160 [Marasmius sp. AFHP31]|nr:hypothetical protein PQX77_008160 [Marasmius sp. AFHP31]
MTVARSDSKWTSISVFINGDNSHTVFTSHSQDYPGTRALRVALDTEVELDSVAVIDRGTLDLLLDYSFRLFSRLCTAETSSGSQLALSWNVTLPPSLDPGTIRESIPLMKFDKEYLRMRQIYDLKSDYCLQRGASILVIFPTNEVREWGHMLDSAVMEVYLCVLEHRFVQPISPSPTHLRPLALEWVRGMEDRISLDKEGCRRRWSGSTEAFRLFEYEATYDILVRELRSLRHLHGNSIIMQRWGEIMDHSDQSPAPSVSELFALPPLHNLEKLRKALFPVFTVNGQANVPTPVYRKMILLLRTSLSRLSDVKASSPLNRIDPCGPGSPEFSPPYTKIRQASEANLNALSLQIDSVQILEFIPWGCTAYDLLRLLVALPPSPSLASLLFSITPFSNENLSLIPSVLQRHRRIMSVLFERRGSAEKTHIDQAIAANRRKWKEDARNGGEFEYIIGCDFNAAHGNKDYSAFSIHQHEILLSDRVDVFAMIYIPRPGKITLNLSIKPEVSHIVNLIASLTRSVSGSVSEVGVTSDDGHTVRFDVVETDSPGFETVSVEGFPELRTGCYELRIQNSHTILFKKLTIEFTERSADKESDESSNSGSGEVEDAGEVQEGEEANGRENSSVEVKEQPRRSLELHPGTQGKELGDYLGLSRSIVERSLRDYETIVICWNMFPDPDNHKKQCSYLWNYHHNKLVPKGELPFILTAEVSCLMATRGTQSRSVSCERVEPFIAPLFGFNTETHQVEVVRANQRKYALLATNFGWYYKDPENRTGYMEHPIIVTAICKALFYNETAHGTLLEWQQFFRPVIQKPIAFLFTLIDHCLSKWSSGKYIDREMEEDKLSPVYNRHLDRIDEWLKLDEVLTKSIRMGWTIQGLAHAKSFPQDKNKIESGSESHTKADSAAGSGSQPENKAERPSSSRENTVELRPGPDTASEDTQGELALEGPGRDLGDASRASQVQTEARSESFQPDNGVE